MLESLRIFIHAVYGLEFEEHVFDAQLRGKPSSRCLFSFVADGVIGIYCLHISEPLTSEGTLPLIQPNPFTSFPLSSLPSIHLQCLL